MTARGPATSANFVVDETHLGTSEAAWETSTALARTPALVVPDVDRVVVVSPHPDDEALGAGGLLQMLAARGTEIEVCAVTDGEAFAGPVSSAVARTLRGIRTRECLLALGRLGLTLSHHVRLGVPDGAVSRHESDLTSYLSTRLGPDTLCLAPWRSDGHPDHDASGRARGRGRRGVGCTAARVPGVGLALGRSRRAASSRGQPVVASNCLAEWLRPSGGRPAPSPPRSGPGDRTARRSCLRT